MPVPTHRASCQTRIWPAYCHDCERRVYYFSCSCGSKVFFELNEPPWIMHADRCPCYHIRVMVQDGADPKSIRQIIESHAREENQSISDEVEKCLQKFESELKSRKGIIIPNMPNEEPFEISGKIVSLNRVNFFKRYKYDDNKIMRSVLGKLVEEPHLELTVCEVAMPGKSTLNQATFFVEESEVHALKLRMGKHMYAHMEMHQVASEDDQLIWLATVIDND